MVRTKDYKYDQEEIILGNRLLDGEGWIDRRLQNFRLIFMEADNRLFLDVFVLNGKDLPSLARKIIEGTPFLPVQIPESSI